MGLADRIREKLGRSDAGNSVLEVSGGPETLATLMLLVARSDGGLSPEEHARIKHLLQTKTGLRSMEALALIAEIAETEIGAYETDRLIATLKQELSAAGKEELMLMVLEVIAADNEKDAGEMRLLSNLVEDLGISEKSMDRVYRRYFRGETGTTRE